jgi:hypothetical protein
MENDYDVNPFNPFSVSVSQHLNISPTFYKKGKMSEESRRRIWNYLTVLYQSQLDERSNTAEQPAWIRTPLLNHQKTSLAAALALEKAKTGMRVDPLPGERHGGIFYTRYGIIGDRVGSGKSLVALSLIRQPFPDAIFPEYIRRTATDRNVGLMRESIQDVSELGVTLRPVRTAIFIVPHALMDQWIDYVREDTELNCAFIRRNREADDSELWEKIDTYDAVFVSSTMWKTFESSHPVHTVLWSRAVIDEADTIALTLGEERLQARFYWMVSASWINIIFSAGASFMVDGFRMPMPNTAPEVQSFACQFQTGNYIHLTGCRSNSIRKFCGQYYLSDYNTSSLNSASLQSCRMVIRNSEEHIRKSFNIPVITHVQRLCLAPANVRVFHEMISSEMMERLHAGDTEGVLGMLGMSASSADQIADAITSSIRAGRDLAIRTLQFKSSLTYSSEHAKQKAIETLEERIARLSSQIESIESRIRNSEAESCPICFCQMEPVAVVPCCKNMFCLGCICEAVKNNPSCPLCRHPVNDLQDIQVIGKEDAREKIPAENILSKKDEFVRFVVQNPDSRILAFSGYDGSFSELSEALGSNNVTHATILGSGARVTKMLRDFENGKYRVLFLNARNMGAGLNIRAATHIVLYHKMPVETQNQIIGRAIRLGRTTPLTVLHLLHGNEMEATEPSQTWRQDHVDPVNPVDNVVEHV